jgi:hypothetical protein
MKNDNLAFLRNDLKYLGFGEAITFNEQLEREILKGTDEFQLRTEARFDEWTNLEATLYFRKGDNYDMYFFNKYDALLTYEGDPRRNKAQTFYVSKGKGVTFKEAFNLLEGRAVFKNLIDAEGVKYHAWIQLSFSERIANNTNYRVRQFGERYGYDLEKVLSNYPIRELDDEKLRIHLLYSLKKGNVHPVTFAKSSKIETMFIEACPEFKTITIHSELTRAVQRPSLSKGNRIKEVASILPTDPESPPEIEEKEEEKNEEKEPPVESQAVMNGSTVKKRNRRPDSL